MGEWIPGISGFRLSPSTACAGKYSLGPLAHHSFSFISLLFVDCEFLKDRMASPKCQLADQLAVTASLAKQERPASQETPGCTLCLRGSEDRCSSRLCRAGPSTRCLLHNARWAEAGPEVGSWWRVERMASGIRPARVAVLLSHKLAVRSWINYVSFPFQLLVSTS